LQIHEVPTAIWQSLANTQNNFSLSLRCAQPISPNPDLVKEASANGCKHSLRSRIPRGFIVDSSMRRFLTRRIPGLGAGIQRRQDEHVRPSDVSILFPEGAHQQESAWRRPSRRVDQLHMNYRRWLQCRSATRPPRRPVRIEPHDRKPNRARDCWKKVASLLACNSRTAAW